MALIANDRRELAAGKPVPAVINLTDGAMERTGNGAKGNHFRLLLGRALREKEMNVFAFPAVYLCFFIFP